MDRARFEGLLIDFPFHLKTNGNRRLAARSGENARFGIFFNQGRNLLK